MTMLMTTMAHLSHDLEEQAPFLRRPSSTVIRHLVTLIQPGLGGSIPLSFGDTYPPWLNGIQDDVGELLTTLETFGPRVTPRIILAISAYLLLIHFHLHVHVYYTEIQHIGSTLYTIHCI